MINKPLKTLIKKRISNRLLISFFLIFVVFIFQNIWEIHTLLSQKEKDVHRVAKDLAPYIISQELIENRYAIDIKINSLQKENNYHITLIRKTNDTPNKLYFHLNFEWTYIYPLFKEKNIGIDNKFIYFKGSILDESEVINDFLSRTFILILFYSLIVWMLLPIYSRLPYDLIINPIQRLIQSLEEKTDDKLNPNTPKEVLDLNNKIKDLLLRMERQSIEIAHVSLAKQMAHDIRSPVLALETILKISPEIPEEKLSIIKNSLNRIIQIAKNIEKNEADSFYFPQMISPLFEYLINEKKAEHNDKEVVFNLILNNNERSLIDISNEDLNRTLSNVINNAIEASEHQSPINITISIHQEHQNIHIDIADNGHGIQEHYVNSIFNEGFSINKQSGKGIGLAFCKERLNKAKGDIALLKTSNQGSTFRLTVPIFKKTNIIVNNIDLSDFDTVCVLDDEKVVHESISKKIRNSAGHIAVYGFTLEHKLSEYIKRNTIDRVLFFIDYDIKSNVHNGIDVINNLNIQSKSILFTSHYNSKDLYNLCLSQNIKILPKPWVSFL